MIFREKFRKVEEILLYLFGLGIFLDYKITKFLIGIIIILLILRKVLFKENLNCGNKNLKLFILYYIIIGTCWNFLGGMSYKPARSFLKMTRYISLLFFMYPLIQNKKDIIKKFLFCGLISYIILFQKVFEQFISKKYFRVSGFMDINVTSIIASIVGSFVFSILLDEEKILKKLGYLIVYISTFVVLIATKGRGALVALITTSIIIVGINIFENRNLKKIMKILVILFLVMGIGYKAIPSKNFNRFKTTFNMSETPQNASNYIRIEMWKNALWRIKQKPILGYGTKFDSKNMFKKYVKNMPEKTENEKYIKKIFLNGFDDSHNMYLNAFIDNGLFVLNLLIIWFIIPSYIFFKYIRKIEKKGIFIGFFGGISSFLIQGLFWPIWRKPDQMYFWIFFSLIIVSLENNHSKNRRKLR